MMEAFTDGACLGNPGPGGWAALVHHPEGDRLLAGGEAHTTNNRMELMGAIAAIESVAAGTTLKVVTDSQYVKKGIESWIASWKKRGWRTADGQPVKNQDLWERLDAARATRSVTFGWVRGHSGHPDNERVDEAARQQAVLQRRGGRA